MHFRAAQFACGLLCAYRSGNAYANAQTNKRPEIWHCDAFEIKSGVSCKIRLMRLLANLQQPPEQIVAFEPSVTC